MPAPAPAVNAVTGHICVRKTIERTAGCGKVIGRKEIGIMKKSFLLFGLLLPLMSFAQQYSIDWHKIAGGGGTSSGGNFSLSGTIGQPDASGAMTGGSYSLTGGFWSIIAAVQTAGTPNLTITFISPNSVQVSWPDTGTYTLLQKSSLTNGSWTTNSSSVSTANGTNSVTITPPNGNLFFRLSDP
jgi:hypothetical protein